MKIRTLVAAVAIALVTAAPAFAHAELSPPIALAKTLQLFTLAVPTEKENARTTTVELTLPADFSIDSFVPASGWHRQVEQTGSGENAVIQKVTWTGGSVPTDEDSVFQFLATASSAKTYSFAVRQTYSDGSIVDWSGPESSDTPAPRVEARGSLGGGGNSTLGVVAVALAAVALVVALVGLLAGGRRTLA
jgi:uncharacterized protein YcnI